MRFWNACQGSINTLYSLNFYKENIVYISMHAAPQRKQYIQLSVDMLMWTYWSIFKNETKCLLELKVLNNLFIFNYYLCNFLQMDCFINVFGSHMMNWTNLQKFPNI